MFPDDRDVKNTQPGDKEEEGLSPESFSNSLCMYSFRRETLWHMARGWRVSLSVMSVCVCVCVSV